MKLLHRMLVLVICGVICLSLAPIPFSVEESNNKMSLNNIENLSNIETLIWTF